MERADVVVIGGGIIGCAIAYYLAKENRHVILLEKQALGQEASAAAAGMLGAQVENHAPGALYQLSLASRKRFLPLAEELHAATGIDIELNRTGMLRVARSEREQKEIAELASWQINHGEAVHSLEKDALRAREPHLAEDVISGLYIPHDYQVSAVKLTQAFAEGAARKGAQLREYQEVQNIVRHGGKIVYVETADATYAANDYVLAAGAWSGTLAARLGIGLPVKPLKGEMFAFESRPAVCEHTLFMNGCYLVPKRDGTIFVGATEVDAGYDKTVTIEGLRGLMERAGELLPMARLCRFNRAWAGLRPFSADGLPFIGRHQAAANLVIATGHHRNGILLSPITGEIVAALITGKQTAETKALLSLCEAFSPNRQSVRTLS
ncbi:glycine oxidase ThiO [Bacillaceae bacterium]